MVDSVDYQNSIVSIIIPTFNSEKYIERCINSLQKQSYSQVEIIVVDDGSTDSTGKILDEISRSDSRIKVLHQKNTGVSNARNLGIQTATGQWIMFCDSDDEYPEYAVERLLGDAVQDVYDVISGSHTVVTKSGTRKYVNIEPHEFHDKDSIVKYFLYEGAERNFIWERIYKKSLFENIKFKPGRYYEDLLLTIDLCREINSLKVINESVYDYRINNASLTNGVRKDVHMDLLNARLEQLDFIKNDYPQMVSRVYDLILAACCFIMSRFCAGKVEKQDEDYKRVIETFRKYKRVAPKNSGYLKIASLMFSISPMLLAYMCKTYSDLKNR